MKSAIIEVSILKPFEEVLSVVRANIRAEGFLLLHEINTQEILANHGITIGELRQIFFFHPSYMVDILKNDPLAVNEVPLKLVIRSTTREETHLSFPNPVATMMDYNCDKALAVELLKKIRSILEFAI